MPAPATTAGRGTLPTGLPRTGVAALVADTAPAAGLALIVLLAHLGLALRRRRRS
jgi:hypothetical protein